MWADISYEPVHVHVHVRGCLETYRDDGRATGVGAALEINAEYVLGSVCGLGMREILSACCKAGA